LATIKLGEGNFVLPQNYTKANFNGTYFATKMFHIPQYFFSFLKHFTLKHLTTMNKLIFTITLALFFITASINAQSVPPPPSGGNCDVMDGFRTQTIGGWGATPSGNNPGTYLHANFNTAFPMGLTVGTGANKIVFSSAQAITEYLPAGGRPTVINNMYINPATRELKNTLVSQLVALTLSLRFDKIDPNFSKSSTSLDKLVMASGLFRGKSVAQMLTLANAVLAGTNTSCTPQEITTVITSINESFVDGNMTGMALMCPF